MRDPKRIKEILRTIERIWKKAPDLRLGQLLENVAYTGGWKDKDLFYLEDGELYSYLIKYEVTHVPNKRKKG